ncbi:hypothetical protein HOG98_07015 [bacterium]|jgi:hypothetical protein|nr:hypothetical protein [bacterium]
MHVIDMSQLRKYSLNPNLPKAPPPTSRIENPTGMKTCIETFKASILDLFKDKKQIKCILLAPKSQIEMALYLSKDDVYFVKNSEDPSNFKYVIDFKTNLLKSKTTSLHDLDVLERLIKYFEKLIHGLSDGSATLFEGTEDV